MSNPFVVIAYLGAPISLSNPWMPMLDGLLEYLWLEERGLTNTQPTKDTIIFADIPLTSVIAGNHKIWSCSAPFYNKQDEFFSRYRKRWDYQDRFLDWQGKKKKVDTSHGTTKAWDLPLLLYNISSIVWFAHGDLEATKELLNHCTHLGKKRSLGYGEVLKWHLYPVQQDWSLYKNGILTRPYPVSLIGEEVSHQYLKANWAWRSPYWMNENKTLCYMSENILATELE